MFGGGSKTEKTNRVVKLNKAANNPNYAAGAG